LHEPRITRPSPHPHPRPTRPRRPGGGSPRSNRLETTPQRPTRHHSYTTSPDGTRIRSRPSEQRVVELRRRPSLLLRRATRPDGGQAGVPHAAHALPKDRSRGTTASAQPADVARLRVVPH